MMLYFPIKCISKKRKRQTRREMQLYRFCYYREIPVELLIICTHIEYCNLIENYYKNSIFSNSIYDLDYVFILIQNEWACFGYFVAN